MKIVLWDALESPTMAPTTVSGKCTKDKMATIRAMVVTGSAAVESAYQATVFTTEKTTPRGTGKMAEARITFQTLRNVGYH